MKKLTLLFILLTGVMVAQEEKSYNYFDKGTVSCGTLFSYQSYDSGNEVSFEHSGTTTQLGQKPYIYFKIQPLINYFYKPNISIDGIFGSITEKTEYDDDDDDDEYKTSMIGMGTTYYYQNFYIGGGIIKQSSESESGEWSYESSQQFMNFNGGYLHKLNESVFLDIGLQYLKGMGETETESNGDSLDDIDNEETYFSMNVGIRAFFNPKLP